MNLDELRDFAAANCRELFGEIEIDEDGDLQFIHGHSVVFVMASVITESYKGDTVKFPAFVEPSKTMLVVRGMSFIGKRADIKIFEAACGSFLPFMSYEVKVDDKDKTFAFNVRASLRGDDLTAPVVREVLWRVASEANEIATLAPKYRGVTAAAMHRS